MEKKIFELGKGITGIGTGSIVFRNGNDIDISPTLSFGELKKPIKIGTNLLGTKNEPQNEVTIVIHNLKGLEVLKAAVKNIERTLKSKERCK